MMQIYSCLFGNYDELLPAPVFPWCPRPVLITDAPQRHPGGWKVIVVQSELSLSVQKRSREYKILPWRCAELVRADVLIYVDANLRVKDGHRLLQTASVTKGMTLTRHPDRSSVREEVAACVRLNKDKHTRLRHQWVKYQEKGFKDAVGLWQCGFNIRRVNNYRVRMLCEAWWEHVVRFSHRDQISFPYCVEMLKMQDEIQSLPPEAFNNHVEKLKHGTH